MKQIAVFPGTFDPITCGHKNIVERAIKIFRKIIVAIAENKFKSPLFSLEQRVHIAESIFSHINEIEVRGFSNLLVDFAYSEGAHVIIRGLRVVSDFEYEFQLSNMNRRLAPNIETIFLTPSEQYSFVSSTLVKDVALHGGDISTFVPKAVVDALHEVSGTLDNQ